MKIIHIEFKNINNLKGEHSISFDHAPLSTAGIFAIVGPTGAGKSTILDVITLALFNRIPRFSKPISKNEITREGSVVTHHTKEASASIEYEIKGQKYKSSWSVESNKKGALKDYHMSFYMPDGSVADLKKSEVPGQNEAIIGLKYDQFVKSILLSQGAFSKFLKADKNERGALLENLTGTSIYRNIGRNTFVKYKEVKDTLDLEQKLIGGLVILEDEQRTALEHEVKTARQDKEALDKTIVIHSDLLLVKTETQKIMFTLDIKTKESKVINDQALAFESNKNKLDIHHRLSPIQGALATYNNALENATKSKGNLSKYKADLEAAQHTHQTTIAEMATLTKQKVDAQSFKSIMNAFETEINTADQALINLKNKGKETRERINRQKASYGISLEDNVKPNEALSILTDRSNHLQGIIKNAPIDTAQPIHLLKESLAESKEEIKRLTDIHAGYQKVSALELKLANDHKKLVNYKADLKRITPDATKSQALVNATDANIKLLIKQKEDAIKIASLEEMRTSLVKGEPCALCGSLEHPYTAHNPGNHEHKIEIQIQEAQGKLKGYQTELRQLTKDLSASQTGINIVEQSINNLSVEHQEINDLLKEKVATLSGALSLSKDTIESILQEKTTQIRTTEKAIDAITEVKNNKDLVGLYHELTTIGQSYTSMLKDRKAKFGGDKINPITNKLQDTFEGSKSKMTELTAVIKTTEENLTRAEGMVASSSKEIQPKINDLGFANIQEINNNILDESTLNRLTHQKDQLTNQQTKIKTELITLKESWAEKQQLDTDPKMPIETLKDILREKRSLAEKLQNTAITNQEKLKRDDADRAQIQAKEKKVSALKMDLEKWAKLNKMIGDATGSKFANFAQGLTLQNLLVYANRRLGNLSDRYLLDKPENDGPLIIVDKYQGSSKRSVKTLSGGESFLISLALALSLSDMASKNVALECLFIDEGFGTLDQDTLELAMTTLEKLQSESQKTVGVISHVEALKERINVQIKLNKNTQGYSEIEIVS